MPNKQSNNRNRSTTLRNHLIDKPQHYLTADVNIAVSSIAKLVLKRDDYRLLQSGNSINLTVINFIFEIFKADEKEIQFETSKTKSLITNSTSIVNIKKKIFIGCVTDDEQHFRLIIIDAKKQTFSYVDPSTRNPPELHSYYESFLGFVKQHNKKFKAKIPSDGWSLISLDHELQDIIPNSGIFILNFNQQYLKSSNISGQFDANSFRLELQHLVLRKATNMKDRCVICGLKDPLDFQGKHVEWIQCCACLRWDHVSCGELNSSKINDNLVKYFCHICTASASH